jgi:hypothetical protein
MAGLDPAIRRRTMLVQMAGSSRAMTGKGQCHDRRASMILRHRRRVVGRLHRVVDLHKGSVVQL